MQGFHVEHFGCRAARADGVAVSDRLRCAGFCEQQPSEADVVIVNTCSVTAEADRAARAYIRRTHRLNPTAKIVVTGCYAQRAPEELARLEGVAAVVGNSHKALAPQIVHNILQGSAAAATSLVHVQSTPTVTQAELALPQVVWADDRFAHSFLEEAQLVPGVQTRPNLKIQEGCGNRCTFCVIPQTRGPSKSLAAASVLKQVEGFVAAGGKELVLSGINLGRWGRDLSGAAQQEMQIKVPEFPPLQQMVKSRSSDPLSLRSGSLRMTVRMGHGASQDELTPRTLAELVRRIFERTELPRLRLSSIEPMDWNEELIGLMAEFGNPQSSNSRQSRGRLARHAHLPLQSGSDSVLRRMHRRYRPWHYVEKVEALVRAAGPHLTLGADVMVGFPGETDAEYEETLALVRALPFGYLHLFPFSPRPGTPSWAMHAERPVRAAVVEERMAALRVLAAEKSRTHRTWMIGKELEAITLHSPAELVARGRTAAMTENFLPVEIEGHMTANHLVRLSVTGLTAEGTLEAMVVKTEQD
jgi:threonylcarbamoyladenosine tRNA methylthiotransferase MtaB